MIGHYDEPTVPWLIERMTGTAMQIDEKIKDNAVFLGIIEKDVFVPKATAFFVARQNKFGSLVYLVTAEHVVAGLKAKGYEKIYMRPNTEAGLVPIPVDNWLFHQDAETNPTDVAVVPITYVGDSNERLVTMDVSTFVTKENFKEREWGTGDEVVVVGLFRNHYGKAKNIPVVRIGSLAAMPEEPVKTKWSGYIDAYLVELHSIGGLSGSPVYIHHPPTRVRDGKIQYLPGHRMNLLGIMQGHFDVPDLRQDSAIEDDDGGGSINTGIGVVVPAYKILEMMDGHPELVAAAEKALRRSEADAAKSDLDHLGGTAELEPPTTADNPTHAEDFRSLVTAAARKKPQGDGT